MTNKILIWSFFIIIPLIILTVFFQYRHFYKIENIVFTFWKTRNGCYIMPYKYCGLTIPKDNYLKTVNIGGILIFIDEDSTLYIFPNNIYELGAKTIECKLSSYNYKYYPYIDNEMDDVNNFYKKIDNFMKQGYPYLNIYIREMGSNRIWQSVNLFKNSIQ